MGMKIKPDERDLLDLNKDLNSKETERVLTKFITNLFLEYLPDSVFNERSPNWITIKISKILKELNSVFYSELYYQMIREKYGISLGDIILDVYDHSYKTQFGHENFQIDLIVSIITGIDFFPDENRKKDSIVFKYNEMNLFTNDLYADQFFFVTEKYNKDEGSESLYTFVLSNTSSKINKQDMKENKFFELVEKIKDMSINNEYLSSVLEPKHKKYINDIYDDINTLKSIYFN
jgi:hypothetical protein